MFNSELNSDLTIKIISKTSSAVGNGEQVKTLDFSDVPNYNKLTSDNFAITKTWLNPKNTDQAPWLTISYNNTTGMVTVKTSASNILLLDTTVTCFYI